MFAFLKRKPLVAAGGSPDAPETDEEAHYRPLEWWIVRKLARSLWPRRKLYGMGLACSITHVTIDQLDPQFIGALVNFCAAVVSDKPQGGAMLVERLVNRLAPAANPAQLSNSAAVGHVLLIIGFWACAIGCSLTLQRATILLMTRAGEATQFDYRKRMFAHLQRLSMSYFDKTKLGRIISRMTSDINGMREVNVWGVAHICAHSLVITIASVMMLWTDWRIFLAVAWLAPVIYLTNWTFVRMAGRQWQIVREGFTRLSSNLAENITGVRVVTAFNRQDPNLLRFNELQQQNTLNNIVNARINGVFQPSLEVIRHTGRAIVILVGGYLLATGRLEGRGPGTIVAVYGYWDRLMGSIVFLGGFYNQLMQAMAGAERVFSLFDIKPDVEDVVARQAAAADHRARPVRPRHVRLRPRTPDPPRRLASPRCPARPIALVGHTGSGKTSISSLIARFYQPQSGQACSSTVFDIRHDLPATRSTSRWGSLAKATYLFAGTVMENVQATARPTRPTIGVLSRRPRARHERRDRNA